ncbi:MAG: RDD family protein [Firmicutes bacterium]|nr:RDD family protein [Bacillota bacterium]
MAGTGYQFLKPENFKNPGMSETFKNYFLITLIAGILLTMGLPTLAGFIYMPFMFKGMMLDAKTINTSNAVKYDGKIWYTESKINDTDNYSLVSLNPQPDAKPEKALDLRCGEPYLLADDNRLLIISKKQTIEYKDGKTVPFEMEKIPEHSTFPFFYDHVPAVIQAKDNGGGLLTFRHGHWVEEKEIVCTSGTKVRWFADIKRLQVLVQDGSLHLFFRTDENDLKYCFVPDSYEIKDEDWQDVTKADTQYRVYLTDGKPGVAVYDYSSPFSNPDITFLKNEGKNWVVSAKDTSGVFFGFTVLPGRNSGELIIVAQKMPGRVVFYSFAGGKLEKILGTGSPFPFNTSFLIFIIAANAVSFIIPLIAAYILSGLMEKNLISVYQSDNGAVNLASLWKRAVARIIDNLIVTIPVWFFQFRMIKSMFFSDDGGFPFNFLENMIGILLSFFIMLILTVFISYMDGKGQTPGKMIMGIKTVRIDNLEPCGFLMGFARNMAMIIDGAFAGFVGLGLIAYTSPRQRLGDLAAKTMVIDIKNPVKNSDFPSQI